MKIYLAGPMRGIPRFNFPAFDEAAKLLREQGHSVFSPADHDRQKYGTKLEEIAGDDEAVAALGFNIRHALAVDTQYICLHAEAIALLPGWERSRGAMAEWTLAKALGLTIIILGSDYHA